MPPAFETTRSAATAPALTGGNGPDNASRWRTIPLTLARLRRALGRGSSAIGAGNHERRKTMAHAGACPNCLRRSWLLSLIAPYIEKALDPAKGELPFDLLRLDNGALVEA